MLDGALQVYSSQTKGGAVTTLGAQSFFGEMSLLNPMGETVASVVVRTYLEGYLLSKASFAWLERHHPVFRDYIESAARLRLQAMQSKVTDTRKLDALYDVLDPTKRRLIRKNKQQDKSRFLGAAARLQADRGVSGTLQRSATRRLLCKAINQTVTNLSEKSHRDAKTPREGLTARQRWKGTTSTTPRKMTPSPRSCCPPVAV